MITVSGLITPGITKDLNIFSQEKVPTNLNVGNIFTNSIDPIPGDSDIIAVGGVYDKQNISSSHIRLISKGTLHGNEALTDTTIPVYNYLTSLLPGTFPSISGPFTETQEFYSLTEILSQSGYFCKVLGQGIGMINLLNVSKNDRRAANALTSNFIVNTDNRPVGIFNNLLNFINFSDIRIDYISPQTIIGADDYITDFNWQDRYNLININGTNNFPYFNWSGYKLGTTISTLNNDRSFNYIDDELQSNKTFIPIGLIYAGQGLQYNIYDNEIPKVNEEIVDTGDNVLGVQAYQQGKGIYEFVVRDLFYQNNLIDILELYTTIPSEGIQPGRNNAFAGVSLESDDVIAPLATSEDLGNNPLPWNLGYTSENEFPVLTEGLTTMVISGAYPLYRRSNNGEWNGQFNYQKVSNTGNGTDQYYFTEEFWQSEFNDPVNPEILYKNNSPPVQPNPPYRIKGGRIVLFEGQKVLAGSYVYSTANMVANVNIPQFYPPSGKELIINNRTSIGNGKYQSNQGGIIVMVVEEGCPPPIPPSCAQPIGVVLETIEGFGSPTEENDQVNFDFQSTNTSNSKQKTYDQSTTNNIQGREVLIRLFPMYGNMNLTGFPKQFFNETTGENQGFPFPNTNNFDPEVMDRNDLETYNSLNPLMAKVKSSYMLNTSPYSWRVNFNDDLIFNGLSLYNKQFTMDNPGPQSKNLTQ